MESDYFTVLIGLVVAGLMVIGAAALIAGTPDFMVIKSCKTRGYWQSGQTRVICHVEGESTVPKVKPLSTI